MREESRDEARERREREGIRDIAQGRTSERADARDAEALDRPASEAEETERDKAREKPHWDVAWRQPQ